MIYSAHSESRLAKSRSVSDNSLPERQLSTRPFPIGMAGPAQLEGGSQLENAEPRLPESRVPVNRADQNDHEQYDLELATHIVARIELRLPGRIRHLTVFTTENAVILSGECSTFYTKQVAQHAAMGVLEYEQLINNIDVRTA